MVILDKSDSRLHIEQIEKLMAAGKYSDAAFLADKVDWRKEEDNYLNFKSMLRKNKGNYQGGILIDGKIQKK